MNKRWQQLGGRRLSRCAHADLERGKAGLQLRLLLLVLGLSEEAQLDRLGRGALVCGLGKDIVQSKPPAEGARCRLLIHKPLPHGGGDRSLAGKPGRGQGVTKGAPQNEEARAEETRERRSGLPNGQVLNGNAGEVEFRGGQARPVPRAYCKAVQAGGTPRKCSWWPRRATSTRARACQGLPYEGGDDEVDPLRRVASVQALLHLLRLFGEWGTAGVSRDVPQHQRPGIGWRTLSKVMRPATGPKRPRACLQLLQIRSGLSELLHWRKCTTLSRWSTVSGLYSAAQQQQRRDGRPKMPSAASLSLGGGGGRASDPRSVHPFPLTLGTTCWPSQDEACVVGCRGLLLGPAHNVQKFERVRRS